MYNLREGYISRVYGVYRYNLLCCQYVAHNDRLLDFVTRRLSPRPISLSLSLPIIVSMNNTTMVILTNGKTVFHAREPSSPSPGSFLRRRVRNIFIHGNAASRLGHVYFCRSYSHFSALIHNVLTVARQTECLVHSREPAYAIPILS